MSIFLKRLLELSGRVHLHERLTPSQAKAIMVSHGADQSKLSDLAYLKSFRLKVNKQNHPDVGGDGRAAAEVNAAYDTLKVDPTAGDPAIRRKHEAPPDAAEKARRQWDRWGSTASANGKSYADHDDAPSTALYVWDGNKFDPWDSVKGSSTDIAAFIEKWQKLGDIRDSDVVVGIAEGWSQSVMVLFWSGKVRVLNPPTLSRSGDGPLEADTDFAGQFSILIDKIIRKSARHDAYEREERESRGSR